MVRSGEVMQAGFGMVWWGAVRCGEVWQAWQGGDFGDLAGHPSIDMSVGEDIPAQTIITNVEVEGAFACTEFVLEPPITEAGGLVCLVLNRNGEHPSDTLEGNAVHYTLLLSEDK